MISPRYENEMDKLEERAVNLVQVINYLRYLLLYLEKPNKLKNRIEIIRQIKLKQKCLKCQGSQKRNNWWSEYHFKVVSV